MNAPMVRLSPSLAAMIFLVEAVLQRNDAAILGDEGRQGVDGGGRVRRLDAEKHGRELALQLAGRDGRRLDLEFGDGAGDLQPIAGDGRDMLGHPIDEEDRARPRAPDMRPPCRRWPRHPRQGWAKRSFPVLFDQRPGLLHRDGPERHHVLVRFLVVAAEIPVAEFRPDLLGVAAQHLVEIHHRLLLRRRGDTLEARPGEILHP